MAWKVQWAKRCERKVTSLTELDALLDDLHTKHQGDRAVLVTVESPESGDSLAIGVGRDLSVLNYVPGTGDPPYFTSLGNESAKGTIVFHFMGQWSEFSMRNAIPFDQARKAVRFFFETGKLSDKVKWEED